MTAVNNTLGGMGVAETFLAGQQCPQSAHQKCLQISQQIPQRILQQSNVKKIIIEGQTQAGRKFRPSDWAERMSGALSTFGRDHRIRYSPLLQPLTIGGIKCVALDPKLQEQFPEMYSYIMGWANNNNLVISEGDPETHSTETVQN